MKNLKWQEWKEDNRKKALDRHERLHKLFVEDRLGFERERKKMIDEFFDGIEDEDLKSRLRGFQNSWDTRMRHAGSAHNRLVLAQTFFWSHFHEVWHPAIQDFNLSLNGNPGYSS